MKIVSVELHDIRRFAGVTRIGPFGPGLNLLCAPNESGKSTLFDALQALFFQPHRSKSREVTALRPHVGGAPMVAVEVDLPEGRFTLEKRWLTRPMAQVRRGGALVAQADQAEDFITRLVQSGGEGGPAGLLWVRQGLTGLEGEGDSAKDRDQARLARRSLMTSVTGEVEALTGGRRMDQALARTRADLALYLTPSGRAKAGGPLDEAEAELARLQAMRDELQAKATRLQAALTRRRAVIKDLADLTAPDAVLARTSRLDEAEARDRAAQRHAAALESAAARLRADEVTQAALAERLAGLHRAQTDRARHAENLKAADQQAGAAAMRAQAAAAELAPLAQGLAMARQAKEAADAALAAAHRAEAARAAGARRAELTRRLDEAQALEDRRAPLARAPETGPTQRDLDAALTLWRAVEVERGLRDRGAARIVFHHSGAARVQVSGVAVGEEPLPILSATRFDMPGLGHFTLYPAEGQDLSALARAEASLAAALSRMGAADLPAAQAMARARDEAATSLRAVEATLKALVPEGLGSLRAALAALPPPLDLHDDAPDLAAAQATAAEAAAHLAQAEAAHEAARVACDRLRLTEVNAAADAKGAAQALMQAETALAAFGEGAEASLTAQLALATTSREALRREHDALLGDAPDLGAVQAALARARSIVAGAEADIRRLENERHALNREIELHAGDGVHEELADTETRLGAAEARLDQIRFEVSVLQDLATVLEAARDQARDRYFEPVLTELRPLLRLLWPEAELRFDGESLLPTCLIRDGREEPLSILSGGTQEQVALLVRLAFARLLARQGRHAPILLDDALVYTDDDRIERMFDALHAQAADQQVIVLSCRQRAFRDLGGERLHLAPAVIG